jgi:hypothetical protein
MKLIDAIQGATSCSKKELHASIGALGAVLRYNGQSLSHTYFKVGDDYYSCKMTIESATQEQYESFPKFDLHNVCVLKEQDGKIEIDTT